MITIPVDEGYAFDYLSILQIKFKKKLISEYIYNKCKTNIINQIGYNKTNKIIKSKEYSKLLKSNETVFNMVNLAKKDKILASVVNNENYNRFLLKKEIIKKFFKDKIQLEIKN